MFDEPVLGIFPAKNFPPQDSGRFTFKVLFDFRQSRKYFASIKVNTFETTHEVRINKFKAEPFSVSFQIIYLPSRHSRDAGTESDTFLCKRCLVGWLGKVKKHPKHKTNEKLLFTMLLPGEIKPNRK